MSYMPDLEEIGAGAFSELQSMLITNNFQKFEHSNLYFLFFLDLTTLILASNPKLGRIDVRAFSKNTTNPEILSYPPMEKVNYGNAI